ncbi:MAG: hypothetical protein AAF413_00355 [Patescibacteria group bacterium]
MQLFEQFDVKNRDNLEPQKVVVLDIMGGDGFEGPAGLIRGAEEAAHEIGARIILVGQQQHLEDTELPYVVAEGVVEMGEKRQHGKGAGTSLRVAASLVKDGATGFASACDTGAMVTAATSRRHCLGRHGNFKTPIALTLPRALVSEPQLDRLAHTFMTDGGAFHEGWSAVDLARYGVMTSCYLNALGVDHPTMGLLTNGEELSKGRQVDRDAYRHLADFAPSGNYRLLDGFVEGRNLIDGSVDIVITDGFTGNVALKTAEGVAAGALSSVTKHMRSADRDERFVEEVKTDLFGMMAYFDPNAVGGGLLLGCKANAIVMHGSTNSVGAKAAVLLMSRLAEMDFQPELASTLEAFEAMISNQSVSGEPA